MNTENKKWYDCLSTALQKLDMLGIPVNMHFNKQNEVKAAIGGVFSLILYSITSYVLVYLLIRVYQGKTIEVTETVSDIVSLSENQAVYPFDQSNFVIAAGFFLDAEDYTCIHESTQISMFQYSSSINETGDFQKAYDYYDLEPCNKTHFSDKNFEDLPVLDYMF